MLQDRLTTAQKLVVRHLKKHGFGPRIANRLVTLLYQHLMGLPLLGGIYTPLYIPPLMYEPMRVHNTVAALGKSEIINSQSFSVFAFAFRFLELIN